MTPRARRTVRLALACHRLALALVPRHVRHAHGAEMRETFGAMAEDAATRGSFAVLRTLGRELLDLRLARRMHRDDVRRTTTRSALRTDGQSALRQHLGLHGWRQAFRSILHRPVFSAVVIVTLTLGTVVTTTVFAVVDSVLLAPLPYPDGDRLVSVYEASPTADAGTSLVAPVRMADWQRLNGTFLAISGIYTENATDTSGPDPERLDGRRVAPGYFDVFSMAPLAGRTFTPDEERFGGPAAAVIGEGFWTRRFARDPQAIGRYLTIGGTPVTIVGVMPRAFSPAAIDVWLPAQFNSYMLGLRDARFLNGIGRMKPGVTIDHARDDLSRVQRALGVEFPATDKGWSVRLQDLKEARIGGHDRPIWLVFAAVALLWLIGVANIAGLMVTEMRRRSREMAVRAAIGASRVQIVGAVMREVLVLAAAGSVAGAGLAVWLIAAVPSTFSQIPRITEVAFHANAAIFAGASGVAAALLFGAWPAWVATRGSLAASIAQGGRGSSAGRHRLQRALVVTQVALSVLLVGSALLLARTYMNLAGTNPGFTADDAITFHLGAQWSEDRVKIGQLQTDFVARLEQLPGVDAAGFANFLPMTGATLRSQITVEGLAGPERGSTFTVGSRMMGGHYFRAMHIGLTAGEECSELKVDATPNLQAIVNRRFMDLYSGGQNLIGRKLRFPQYAGSHTIVGVVSDVIEDTPGASVAPYVYSCQSAGAWPDPEYVVRGRDTRAIVAGVRQIAHELDPTRAVFAVRTVGDVVNATLEEPRVSAAMLGLFGIGALALASLGLYSLFMLLVAESTREIGVRLALGAAPGQVMRMVVGGAGRLCLAGVAAGLLLSAAAQRWLGSLLFGVRPLDPLSLGVTTVTLVLATTIAVVIPALRAGRIDPIVAMRTE